MGETRDPRAIGARFEEIARRAGGRKALVGDGRELDFATLERTTRAIAASIVETTLGAPGFVPLLFARKTTGLQAMLAATRCGRPYVPLDAADPDARLAYIVRDCEPAAMLAERGLGDRARAIARGACPVVEIDGDEAPDPGFTLPAVSADTIAYLLYTSGSTGEPKGVTQTQANLAYFVDAFARATRTTGDDRLSLLASLAFSAANMPLGSLALHGATVFTYDMRRDGFPKLAAWIARERITVMSGIPTFARGLFAALGPGEKLPHLRAILVGGETAYASDAAAFLEHTREDAIFINQLSASEADVIAQHVVRHGDTPFAGTILPVGRCQPGIEVRIRRADGSEAGAGEAGTIVVSSAHVSPGYWKRPDLDARTLPSDPRHPGQRCYVGGDLGMIDAAGSLHFLGREGSRVKLRGHSVDLNEVEAALAVMPGIERCAVLASAPELGREADRLVAFVRTATPADGDAATLRERLAQRLPHYMLPSAVVRLAELPSTITGKIDRPALAKLDPPRETSVPAAAPEGDDLEMAVAGVFRRVLKREGVRRNDDFFLLGGDSLRLPELNDRLRDTFGVDLPNLHRDATVAGIAAAIRHVRGANRGATPALSMLVPLRDSGARPPLFLVHGRIGQALVTPHFLALLGNDQPVWAFRLRGLDGNATPHESLEAMARDYAQEIRRVQPRGPYLVGAMCIGALIALEIAHALRDAGEAVLPLLLIDPPPAAFAMSPAQMTEDRLRLRMERRFVATPGETPDAAPLGPEVVRAAKAFERAIRNHRPRAYAGDVCMLLSEDRLSRAPRTQWRKIYAGEITRHIVARTHREALEVQSPVFAAALASSMRKIYAAAATA